MLTGIAIATLTVAVALYLAFRGDETEEFEDKTLDDHLKKMPGGEEPFEEPEESFPEAEYPEDFPHKTLLENRGVTYPRVLERAKRGTLTEISQIGSARAKNIRTYVRDLVESPSKNIVL